LNLIFVIFDSMFIKAGAYSLDNSNNFFLIYSELNFDSNQIIEWNDYSNNTVKRYLKGKFIGKVNFINNFIIYRVVLQNVMNLPDYQTTNLLPSKSLQKKC